MPLQEAQELTCGIVPLRDLVRNVRAVEAIHVNGGVIQSQLPDDISPCMSVCGRRQRNSGDIGVKLLELAKSKVIFAKIMSPGTDAVAFVDSDQGNRHASEQVGKARHHNA